MDINNRFGKIIRVLYGGNKSAFAKAIGVAPTVIDNIVGRRQGKPSFDVLEKISAIAEINIEWLITGKGEMFVDRSAYAEQASNGIPLIPIDAMAGMFQGEQSVLIAECEHYFVPAFRSADFLITVRGDSMQPRYYSGDIVACKNLSLSDIFFQWGKVYVVDTEQGSLIKRIEEGTREDSITLVSENPLYKPFEITKKSIYHIALVLGVIRSE